MRGVKAHTAVTGFFLVQEAIHILNLGSQVALLKIGTTWPTTEPKTKEPVKGKVIIRKLPYVLLVNALFGVKCEMVPA